jgi:TPR repeat protein
MIKALFQTIKNTYARRFQQLAFREAMQLADKGHGDAQFALAEMYEKGNLAVKQNLVKAYVFYYCAQTHDMKEAEHRRELLSSVLSPDQMQEAQHIINGLNTN